VRAFFLVWSRHHLLCTSTLLTTLNATAYTILTMGPEDVIPPGRTPLSTPYVFMCWWLLCSSSLQHADVFINVLLKCNLTHHESKRSWKGPSSHPDLDHKVMELWIWSPQKSSLVEGIISIRYISWWATPGFLCEYHITNLVLYRTRNLLECIHELLCISNSSLSTVSWLVSCVCCTSIPCHFFQWLWC